MKALPLLLLFVLGCESETKPQMVGVVVSIKTEQTVPYKFNRSLTTAIMKCSDGKEFEACVLKTTNPQIGEKWICRWGLYWQYYKDNQGCSAGKNGYVISEKSE